MHDNRDARYRVYHYARLLLSGLTVLLMTACSEGVDEHRPQLDAASITANNRGVALMGRFEYTKAQEVFAQLAAEHPEWLDVQVNLAIATLNRQQEGDEATALAIVERVLQVDPRHLRAHYVAGLLRLYLSAPQEALGHFRFVAESDPKDAYAAYYLGQCLAQQSDYAHALSGYRQALHIDPYLRSAYYGAFQALQRLKQRTEAREMIADYQRLANNPRARLAEFRYTRMGPKAEALAVDLPAPQRPAQPRGPAFADRQPLPLEGNPSLRWKTRAEGERAVSITAMDLQGDGHIDLFIANALRGEVPNLLLIGQDNGRFQAQPTHPLARIDHVNAALWGDLDNDGRVDVYLCRRGPNQLWRQVKLGRWEVISESSSTAGGDLDTVDGAFFDADHDGDLDLFLVNADGPNELLNNNRDGTFQAIAREQGIAGDGRPSRAVIPVDIDRDRDVDLIVINAQPPHEVYLNDRLWTYHPAPNLDRFRAARVAAASAGDIDADGWPELYTLSPEGRFSRWRPESTGQWQAKTFDWAQRGPGRRDLALLDINGDGTLEIVAFTPQGWANARLEGDRLEPLSSGKAKLAGWTPLVVDPGRGPALVGLVEHHGLSIWSPGLGRYAYLGLVLSGMEDPGQSMRSNASGIGAQVAVRVDSRWTLTDTFDDHSGPGQGLQPLVVGLGGAPRVDFIAIDWSDGVYQTELDLEAGRLHRITETQRQLSSCPVLFAWDGKRYAFVADLLGVGGIGYATGPGEYAIPRPWENFLLPPGLLQTREGRYRLKLTEPMEEVAYVDGVRLVAYDLPPGWQMVLDERMGILGPEPTGEPRYYQRERLPSRAVNERGDSVTQTLLKVDGQAAPLGTLDQRFLGRLDHEHILTLDFPEPLDTPPGKPLLVADGWVEYPYSQTSFAAWQAQASFDAPTLEGRTADGRWHTLLDRFGYPAGMPRRMSVPLPALPAGTTQLRLRSNLQVYWDRISVVFAEPLRELRRHSLPLVRARVAKTGFPRRTTGEQYRPHYAYEHRTPFWDTRYLAGHYTRLGPIEELVNAVDDAVAIIGPGEEIHLEFAAVEEALPAGWTRYFVLETHGWTKDRDLFTRDGETLAPLPNTGKPAHPRERLHARYNTRYQSGH